MSGTQAARVRPEVPPEVLQAIRPVSLSNEQLLPVPEPLLPLFSRGGHGGLQQDGSQQGGLQRGWSVGVQGQGAWLVASALLGTALGAEEWMAVVGAEDLNLSASAALGVRLDRVLVVETPSSGQLGAVVSALMEAVQAVVIAPNGKVGARDARRLSARLREQRGTLWHLDGGKNWSTGMDLTLTAETVGWHGLGQGHGHLQKHYMRVSALGRRSASKPAEVNVLVGADSSGSVEFTTAPTLATVTPLLLSSSGVL